MDGYDARSYGEGFADVYDEWYAASGDPVATARAVADLAAAVPSHGTPPVVLELGIGTGRLAIPMRRRGLDVRGIDASPAMLARLAANVTADEEADDVVVADHPDGAAATQPATSRVAGPLPVHEGDFAEVAVPRRATEDDAPPVDVVLCADNTLFNLGSQDAQRRCLAGVARVLRPGGCLVVQAFVPPMPDPLAARRDDVVRVRTLAVDRVVLSASRRDDVAQTMAGQYVDITEAGIRLRPWELHYLHLDQLDRLAGDAGLVLDQRWADWHGEAFDPGEHDDHVSVYRRNEAPTTAG